MANLVTRIKQFVDENLRWDVLRPVGESSVGRATVLVPFLSFILINLDPILEHIPKQAEAGISFLWVEVRAFTISDFAGDALWSLALFYVGLLIFAFGQIWFMLRCPSIVKRFPDDAAYAIDQKPAWWGGETVENSILQRIRTYYDGNYNSVNEIQTIRYYYRATSRLRRASRVGIAVLYAIGLTFVLVPVIERSIRGGYAGIELLIDQLHTPNMFTESKINPPLFQ